MQEPTATEPVTTHPPGHLHRFFAELGPGLITGAADDDPSGSSTYSVACVRALVWQPL